MKIKRLVIENFKSIERIELIEPNPFTVFVGPNGSGKSNIFEALEFWNLSRKKYEARSLFGGPQNYLRRQRQRDRLYFQVQFDGAKLENTFSEGREVLNALAQMRESEHLSIESEDIDNTFQQKKPDEYNQFIKNFARFFVKNDLLVKLPLNDDQRLSLSAKNLEKVLKRILAVNTLRDEIFEWLELFVPGFRAVEIDDRDELHWFEESTPDYFTKALISDGTYNILAILTAVYQSDQPQFLCIEEPENGLNPKVVKELVNLCRYACEEFGHYIWLNTHSQTLVSQLTPDEIILVDKKEGATQTKQIKGMNLHGLPMDEAWLSNALGGGVPW